MQDMTKSLRQKEDEVPQNEKTNKNIKKRALNELNFKLEHFIKNVFFLYIEHSL